MVVSIASQCLLVSFSPVMAQQNTKSPGYSIRYTEILGDKPKIKTYKTELELKLGIKQIIDDYDKKIADAEALTSKWTNPLGCGEATVRRDAFKALKQSFKDSGYTISSHIAACPTCGGNGTIQQPVQMRPISRLVDKEEPSK